MGWSAAATLAVAAVSAYATVSASKAQARAQVTEANIAVKNKSREIRLKAARAQSSFLTSGLTLEGTPENAIDSIFDTGMEDLNLLKKNGQTRADTTISAGRSTAIKGVASAIGNVFGGSFGSLGGADSGGTQIDSLGNGSWQNGAITNYNGGIDPGGTDIVSARF